MKSKFFENFSIIHILDPIKIYFTLNSTFESGLLVTNILFKAKAPLKLVQVCFVLNSWRKDEPKSRPKISLFKKFNLATFIAYPVGALRNLNKKPVPKDAELSCAHINSHSVV